MSDKETLVKIQDLAAAAVGLNEELEVAQEARHQADLQIAAIRANLQEVETAISGLATSLGK